MSDRLTSPLFDAYYYAHGCAAPYERSPELLQFFERIAEHIAQGIQPASVLDAGCAWGFLVEKLRQREIASWGIDISEYAIQNVHPEVKPYCWVGSLTDPLPQRYDLIVSIEVLEHMPPQDAERAIANLCQHSDDILFSSTPFDYKEVTHFNVQPPEYWAEMFARQGFFRDVDFDATIITPWAARYRRQSPPLARLARTYERKFWQLWKENNDLRDLALELREQLTSQETRLQETQARLAACEAQHNTLAEQVADQQKSIAWKIVHSLWAVRLRLAPPGSRRERALLRLVKRQRPE